MTLAARPSSDSRRSPRDAYSSLPVSASYWHPFHSRVASPRQPEKLSSKPTPSLYFSALGLGVLAAALAFRGSTCASVAGSLVGSPISGVALVPSVSMRCLKPGGALSPGFSFHVLCGTGQQHPFSAPQSVQCIVFEIVNDAPVRLPSGGGGLVMAN
jgi:hypothetical protein